MVSGLYEGSVVGFKYLDFDVADEQGLKVYLEMRHTAIGSVEIYVDDICATCKIGEIKLVSASDRKNFCSDGLQVSKGVHGVYFKFYGQKKETDFISFQFTLEGEMYF